MGEEIEKKFLLYRDGVNFTGKQFSIIHDNLRALLEYNHAHGKHISQGYLSIQNGRKLNDRLGIRPEFIPTEYRLRNKEGNLTYTIKGTGQEKRPELEVSIDSRLFAQFWDKTEDRRILKRRHEKTYKRNISRSELPPELQTTHKTTTEFTTEIDVYLDRGLIIAENEVKHVALLEYILPVGKDVTGIGSFKNSHLAQ